MLCIIISTFKSMILASEYIQKKLLILIYVLISAEKYSANVIVVVSAVKATVK